MTKKKICIIIIVILIFIILASVILVFTKKDLTTANEELQQENTTYENKISNVIDKNITGENKVIENTINNTSENVDTSNVTENITKESTNNSKSVVQNNNKEKVEVVSKEETEKITQVETNINTEEIKQEQPKKESTQEVVQETNVEKYVRNDNMINKIKQIIQNNESENMKNFGYNIVVDSSIKFQTNQFTFTKSRVINAIRNKFGTIRIYVEDYYKNGQLIMTECYIL